MKRVLLIFLSLCALSVSALAADGDSPPPRWAFASDEEWQEAAAQSAATESSEPIESAGVENGTAPPPYVDAHPDEKYPVGSYVDAAGHVWSPSGQLLSPDAVPAVEESPIRSGASDNADFAEAPALEPDTLSAIAGMVSDIAEDKPVWYVEDLRPEESQAEVLDGLKALISSIFGEYTPITTTSVITETVGNDTRQYLVETVAPGAAGVDYEWLAGVFLFGILLFCLMKLLGGVLS